MNRNLSMGTVVGVVAVVVLLVAGILWWSYSAPSGRSANSTQAPRPQAGGGIRARIDAMRAEHEGRSAAAGGAVNPSGGR